MLVFVEQKEIYRVGKIVYAKERALAFLLDNLKLVSLNQIIYFI